MYLLGYCFVWPYIYHVDFPPNNKRLGMAPFLTCQKKVVLQVKRKNKRSWRGFEAERVSGSDRSMQFQLTEKIVKYWGKKKTCVSIFPFFIFKVLLRIQQKYNIISQEFALFYIPKSFLLTVEQYQIAIKAFASLRKVESIASKNSLLKGPLRY